MKALKNKSSVVTLLLVAVVVWGIIIYKVIGFTGGSEMTIPVKGGHRVISSNKGDSLLLNYRDPFLGLSPRKNVETPSGTREKTVIEIPDIPPSFRFVGKIKKGKREFLLIVTGEKTRLISTGDKMIDGFLVEKIYADSLRVRKGKSLFTIQKD